VSDFKKFQKGRHVYTKWDSKSKEVRKVMSNERKLKIEIDPSLQAGVYSNVALITHTKEEFIFDFALIQPQAPFAKVVSRVIMSPGHAKRFFSALAENLKKHENTFGEISPSEEKKIGFE